MGSKNVFKIIVSNVNMTLQTVFKTQNIIRVSPEDTLSHVFSLFSSSHDSAFVFDEHNHFLGVVSPYYCLIRKSYPSNTKVKHCMMHPPHIDINFSLKKAAQLMLGSRIYYLPVFEHGQFSAIISARRLLQAIRGAEEFTTSIDSFLKLKKKPLISLYEHDFLSKALALFKVHQVSKLVILTEDLKLRGIISYFDLISYLVVPKEKQHFSSREGNKIAFLKKPVATVMKNNAVTLNINSRLDQAADLILNKHVGSVVGLDEQRRPQGLITVHDLLSIYVGKRRFFAAEIATRNLSQKSFQIANIFIKQINHHLTHVKNLSRAKLFIKETSPGNLFSAALSLFLKNRTVRVIKKQGRNIIEVLSAIKRKSKED